MTQTDGWQKREMGEFRKLGDGEGQVKTASGLLIAIDDGNYDNLLYKLMQESGTIHVVPGSAAMDSQLGPHDVGEFVRLDFTGWGESAAGRKFKQIEVRVWRGEYDEQMKTWPRFREFHPENGSPSKAKPKSEKPKSEKTGDVRHVGEDYTEKPKAVAEAEEEDDGLPF